MDKSNDGEQHDSPSSSPKSKSKGKSLCRLLMQKKTKVGCLFSNSDDMSLCNISSHNKHLKHKNGSSLLKSRLSSSLLDLKEVNEMESIDNSKGMVNNTKLSLCCAMTEGSCSCNTIHSTGQQHTIQLIKRGGLACDGKSVTKSSSEVLRRLSLEEKVSLDSMFHGLDRSKSKTVKEESRHSAFSKSLSTSPTLSETSSNASLSLSNIFPERRSKKFFFAKRLSVDNLLSAINPSASQSSPTSCKSAPDAFRFKVKSSSNESSSSRKEESKNNLMPSSSESTVESSAGTSHNRGYVASMDSLARHSLLAAEVLHLIPTIKARERNFLHGRIAANSLLGPVELERTLPHRELRIFVGTWNMNGQAPPDELNDFILPPSLEHMPDVIVVGTQESYSERFEWEVQIQETLGASHLLFHSAVLGTLHLAVFIRRDLLWFCSVPEEASYSVRPGTAFRTKGAVAIGFTIFGTSYLCITAHLTAHMDKVKERVQDVRRIIRALDLPKVVPIRHKSKDVTQNYDYVFWCGDLNFRLSQPREEVVQWVAEQQFPLPLPHSLHSDQLKLTITEGAVFKGFQEGPITFPPTYKYDPGTQNFDSSHKQRTPAYTDRILYKCRGRGVLECLFYSSVSSICTSDHKPVWGLYSSAVRPGIDTIPLAAGLFNREVYLEGIKRRAAALEKGVGTSAVCSLQ